MKKLEKNKEKPVEHEGSAEEEDEEVISVQEQLSQEKPMKEIVA